MYFSFTDYAEFELCRSITAMVFIFFILSLFLLSPVYAEDNNIPAFDTFVVGGVDSSSNTELPWQVFIEITTNEGVFACGGVVVSEQVVLTAAHCLDVSTDERTVLKADTSMVKVYSGQTNIRNLNRSNMNRVSALEIHKNYTSRGTQNDIAVITLENPIIAPAQPIKILTASEQQDLDSELASAQTNNLLLSGWGKVTADRSVDTFDLQKTELNGVSDSTCYKAWNIGEEDAFSNTLVCGNANNRGACNGDSGGPVVWQNKLNASDADRGYRLAGLVSFGSAVQCADDSLPDAFTQVSSFKTWILSNTTQFSEPSPAFTEDIFSTDFNAVVVSEGSSSGGSTGLLTLLCLCLYRPVCRVLIKIK